MTTPGDKVDLTPPISPHSDKEEAYILHPLLCYSQHEIAPGHCSSILWDLRESPMTARHVSYLDVAIGEAELSHYATSPSLPVLNITCDLFPVPWVIRAQNDQGVTVLNVLEAIFTAVGKQIWQAEWDDFSEKHQQRVNTAFEHRCSLSVHPALLRSQGVLRVDCLMHHTWFGGLSVSREAENSCLLSLRRPR